MRDKNVDAAGILATLHAVYVEAKTVAAIARERGIGNAAVQWQLRHAGRLADGVNALGDLEGREVTSEALELGARLVGA
ncbi:MAG: hypothetical protein ACRDQZ_07350, partial [Mycobacteriales bacterium]